MSNTASTRFEQAVRMLTVCPCQQATYFEALGLGAVLTLQWLV